MQNIHLKYDASSGLTNGQLIKFYISGATSAVTASLMTETGSGIDVNGSLSADTFFSGSPLNRIMYNTGGTSADWIII